MRVAVLQHRGLEAEPGSPWDSLLEGLARAGLQADFFRGDPAGAEALVTMNDQPAVLALQRDAGIPPARSALIVMEPRVTSPRMYTQSRLRRYGIRYAASPFWASEMQASSFPWPQTLEPSQVVTGPFDFAASMIIGDKRSAVEGSLYGLRRQVITEFSRARQPLAVFGPGWDSPVSSRVMSSAKACAKALAAGSRPRLAEAMGGLRERPDHWLGRVADKNTAFAVAPLSIVIENSADYVSEKLVDAIRGGVVPLYVGPSLEEFGLPTDLAVTCPPDAAAILDAATTLSEDEGNRVVESGRAWLASQDALSRDMNRVLHDLGTAIGRRLTDVSARP